MKKITTQAIHGALRKMNMVSDLYKPSQRIDRKGYHLMTRWNGFYTLTSGKYNVEDMATALGENGITASVHTGVNDYKFLKIKKAQ